jgi:hypothetical protein
MKLTVSHILKITLFCFTFHLFFNFNDTWKTLIMFIVKFVLGVNTSGNFAREVSFSGVCLRRSISALTSWNFGLEAEYFPRDRVILQSLHTDIAFVVVGRRENVPWYCDLRWAYRTFCWLQIGVEHWWNYKWQKEMEMFWTRISLPPHQKVHENSMEWTKSSTPRIQPVRAWAIARPNAGKVP